MPVGNVLTSLNIAQNLQDTFCKSVAKAMTIKGNLFDNTASAALWNDPVIIYFFGTTH